MQSLISNLKHQSFLTIILAALAGYAANTLWYYIPFVQMAVYGSVQAPSTMPFSITLWYFINPIINTIGLALLTNHKGAHYGFYVGLIVTVFFSLTGYFGSFVGAGQMPTAALIGVTIVGNLLFYAIPSTILGHLRKA